jgi:hypothetical protein
MIQSTERKKMFIATRGKARLAAVLGMASVLALAIAGPASAATLTNEAFGIRAIGLLNAGPFSHSQFPGSPTSDSLLTVNAAPLLTAGVVNTKAGAKSASASVADLSVTLAPLVALTADAVGSSCLFHPGTGLVTGATSLVGATITLPAPAPPIVLATAPAPNTTIAVPGVAEIIINRQVTDADGALDVDAVYVSLLPGTPLAQVIRISTSHCNPAVLVQIPVIAPAFAAGAGLLGLIVAGFYLARRRRLATTV